MKKIVRTVWISALSGLAFLTACTTSRLTKAEKKQLKEERSAIYEQLDMFTNGNDESADPKVLADYKQQELDMRFRLNEINLLLGDKRAQEDNDYQIYKLNNQLNKINQEIDSLKRIADESEIEPCVYGPPVADDPTPIQELNKTRDTLIQRYREIRQTVERREGACVYGSPEIIENYGKETQRLKQEMNEINKQIEEIEKQIKELEDE